MSLWMVATLYADGADYADAYVDESLGELFMGLSPQCGTEQTDGAGVTVTWMLTTTPSSTILLG